MSYSIKNQSNPETGKPEYVVHSSGGTVPPPNTFPTQAEAESRIAGLELAEELELAEKWNAKPPSAGQVCLGKIVAASDTVLIQNIGRCHILHQRSNSEAFEEIEIDDLVEIKDGEVKYPDRDRDQSRSPSR